MRPPAPPATQQEIAAIKSNARDFDHAVLNLEEMRKRLAKQVAAENGYRPKPCAASCNLI
jgi:hypothetical protein